ncbi:MAG TPA: thymidine phosphorylase [Vicinamibacterales bacterium]|nr:thymidine phosphorylase [Vicinamibacterales bacterium]
MHASDIIRHKRDGGALTRQQIAFLIAGVTEGSIPDYQAAAFLMAAFLRGLNEQETAWLTDAMVRSGERADLTGIPGVKVDKHSTGGVGDKTSLVLAPLAAACGAIVPMMSGRGLGHTGGTVDKLEAIPGFRLDLTLDEMRAALAATGLAMIQQTPRIAPADKKLYALRDVTATVESIPLICGSIMSKKIAEGIDALVLDVKAGRGAFMKSEAEARALATALVAIGRASGLRTHAYLTAMDAPLGRAVGNANEVVEAIETLKGLGPEDLERLSVVLAARMLVLAGISSDMSEAEARVRRALTSGEGLDRFRRMVAQQGGDPRVVDDYGLLPAAPECHVVAAPREGYLASLDAFQVGRASMLLGAGRETAADRVDPGVGIMVRARPGDRVDVGEPVLELHYRDGRRLADAAAVAANAIVIGDAAPAAAPLILGEITA